MTKRTPRTAAETPDGPSAELGAAVRMSRAETRERSRDLFARVSDAFRHGDLGSDAHVGHELLDDDPAERWLEDAIHFSEFGMRAEITWLAQGLADRLPAGDMEGIWRAADFCAELFRLYADAARDLMVGEAAGAGGLAPPRNPADQQALERRLEPHRRLIADLTAGVRSVEVP